MNAGLIDRIETSIDRAASALFGAAVGFAAYAALGTVVAHPELIVCCAAAAIAAHLVCGSVLARVTRGRPHFAVPIFDVRDVEIFEELNELVLDDCDRLDHELVLTEADRLDRDELLLTDSDRLVAADREGALVLDDILAEFGPDSRVVRLFDRKTMPTPGQLKHRIDNHLEQGDAPAPAPDASQALSDALAELRRSLR